MSAREIHDDVVATLGPDAVSYSPVTRYLREARFPPLKPEPHPAALEDGPFTSVRQFSQLTHLPSTTIYHPLIPSLGFVACHLRWVPYALSNTQKGERINLSRRSLRMRMFEVQRHRAWHGMTSSSSTSLGFT
jgi:hypothetical protein